MYLTAERDRHGTVSIERTTSAAGDGSSAGGASLLLTSTCCPTCCPAQEYLAPGGPRLYGLEKFWALLHYAHNVPPYCDIDVHPTV